MSELLATLRRMLPGVDWSIDRDAIRAAGAVREARR